MKSIAEMFKLACFFIQQMKPTVGTCPNVSKVINEQCRNGIVTQTSRIILLTAVMCKLIGFRIKFIKPHSIKANPDIAG